MYTTCKVLTAIISPKGVLRYTSRHMNQMTLSEELTWRGFVNQTTFPDITEIDKHPRRFYFGVDPSADSMTIGNLASAIMARHFVDHGHKAILLVGGATGLIGDPDGKSQERDLKSLEEIAHNKAGITAQYQALFDGKDFEVVDNYDWFKDIGYMDFLRTVGKHVPMSQMLGRDFVQNRLGEGGAGISYAEFSYSLIQGYDFLHLYREKGVTLQLCGGDQWGNSIAGVDLIRRLVGRDAHIWSSPLITNKATGKKFGKTEDGAIWLDPNKTSPYQFYQFWLNVDDASVEDYLKIYTLLSPEDVRATMSGFRADPANRAAQKMLAYEVTKLVHGQKQAQSQVRIAEAVARQKASGLEDDDFDTLINEIPALTVANGASLIDILVEGGLAPSKSVARQFIAGNAVYINGIASTAPEVTEDHWLRDIAFVRRGKVLKNTIILRRG